MTPKIDTLNIAYFIPGIVLTFAIALGASEFESPVPGFTKEMSVTKGAVFLGLSYVVGYAMWALGDILFRTRSDKLIGTYMLYYMCIEKRMRMRFIQIFARLELTKLTALLDSASSALVDDFACEEALECKEIEEKEMGFWWWVLGLRRYAWLQKIFEKLGITKDVRAATGRVRAIAWDEIYNRKNEYHIGRFLSSWNNVKFAKATMCSLLLGGVFCAICSIFGNLEDGFSWGKTLIIGSYMVFGAAYFWIVNWRLRAFARDLVHGLAPNSDVSE